MSNRNINTSRFQKGATLFIVLVLGALYAFIPVENTTENNFYSTSHGALLDPANWDGLHTNSDVGCIINARQKMVVAHNMISNCPKTQVYGNGDLHITNQGTLEVLGSMELFGNSSILVDSGSSLIIHGDLNITGNAEAIVNGNLHITGTLNTTGEGIACGVGEAKIRGVISGHGNCQSLHFKFDNSLMADHKLSNNEHSIEWYLTSNQTGQFIVSKSCNGMSFNEVRRVTALETNTSPYKIQVNPTSNTTTYYQVVFQNEQNQVIYDDIVAVNPAAFSEKTCEDKAELTPCYPACIIDIEACDHSHLSVVTFDAVGNLVSTAVPKLTSTEDLTYRINRRNFLAPGIYVLPASKLSRREKMEIVK